LLLVWSGRQVVGDLHLAQALNSSLYAVRSSIRPDWPYGLSPGGLASNAYEGHTFWDQETWMWPPLLMLDPPSAKSALDYRWNRRVGAHNKSVLCGTSNHASSGGQGALELPADALMFPW
jgi:trehalose/maltose hydrolase-like predicted phosphorylase